MTRYASDRTIPRRWPRTMLALGAAAALLLAACARTPPAPTPTAAPSMSPPATATASPTATPAVAVGVPAPPSWEPDSLAPVAMSAPSGDVVWAALQSVDGPGLFRSTDRGGTWASRGLPPGLKNLAPAFIGDREGWLAADGPSSTRCPDATVALWHTADAGDAWTKLVAADASGPLCHGTLSFIDATHGFLGVRREGAPPALFLTSDGGGTWAEAPALPLDAAANGIALGSVRAFGGTLLLPTGPVGVSGTQGKHLVLRSTDGGQTWTRVAEADISLGLVTARRWIAIGPPGGSRETADAGATWHAYTTDYTQASPIPPAVVFGSGEVGYATTRSTIQRTTDGGAHWTRIATPGRVAAR